MPDERTVIRCNYSSGTKVASEGAGAFVMRENPGGGNDRIVILVRSRGGRWVEKYEDIRRLENFRLKRLPREHARYADKRIPDYDQETQEKILGRLLASRARALTLADPQNKDAT